MRTPTDIGQPPKLSWTDDGRPKAEQFEDSYYAPDPVAESRLVFLEGCGLPERWAVPGGPSRIGETGFGTGLNFLLAWQAWKEAGGAPPTLDFVSVEAYPMTPEQLARSHKPFAAVADYAAQLQSVWPDQLAPGLHQFLFDGGAVRLTLIVGEAVDLAKAVVPGGVEAWFLDGFAPSRNPDMWRAELFETLAAQSAPGARLASFTAAGHVRRGLEAAGFEIRREPGFGGKRHRITGVLATLQARPWWSVDALPGGPVAVNGCGVAGLCAAHALAQAGQAVSLSDKNGMGAGASGNVAALMMPRVHVGGGAEERLLRRYFDTAHAHWTGLGVLKETGVDQHPQSDRDHDRFARFAQHSDARWDGACLHHPRGGWLEPRAALKALTPPPVTSEPDPARIILEAIGAEVEADGDAWPVNYRAGQTIEISAQNLPGRPLVAGEFVVPMAEGRAMVGASFTPHDGHSALEWDDAIERDLMTAAERLGAEGVQVEGRWAGVRVTLPDRLPALGPVDEDGTRWRVTGLGARGFVTAPLLGQLFADCVAGRVLSLDAEEWQLIHAGRFAHRAQQRSQRGAGSRQLG